MQPWRQTQACHQNRDEPPHKCLGEAQWQWRLGRRRELVGGTGARRWPQRGSNARVRCTSATLIAHAEENVELRQLEKRRQVLVEVCQAELPTLRADLPQEGDQHPDTGTVDIAGPTEVDEELALAALEFFEHKLLQLLSVGYDELAVGVDHECIAAPPGREAHVSSPRENA